MNAIIVNDESLISSSFQVFSRYEVAYETTNTTEKLSNVVRDIVPAFNTRDVEISLFIYLTGFGNLQISTNSGSKI